jgi:hypothetical protein
MVEQNLDQVVVLILYVFQNYSPYLDLTPVRWENRILARLQF